MFAPMLAGQFAVFGEVASYTPPGIGAVPVTLKVIRREAPHDTALGYPGTRDAVATLADVRVSDLAQPEERGVLVVGASSYRVRAFDRDSERLVWRLDLEPAA